MFTFKSYYEKSKNRIKILKEEMGDKVLTRDDNPRQFKIKTVALEIWAKNSFSEIEAVNRKLVEVSKLVEDRELVKDIEEAINDGKIAATNQQKAVNYMHSLSEISKDKLDELSKLLDTTKETIDKSNLFEKILNYSEEDSSSQPARETLVNDNNDDDDEEPTSDGGYKKRKSKRKPNRKPKRKWTLKYKRSINCRHPKGFSQRQHCKYGRKTMKKTRAQKMKSF